MHVLILLLFIFIALSLLTFSLENITREENIYNFSSHAMNTRDNLTFPELYEKNKESCEENQTSPTLKLNIGNKKLSCEKILSEESSKENYKIYITEDIMEEQYKKDYSCSFVSCALNEPFFLVSKEANDFYDRIKTFLVLGAVLIALLILVKSSSAINFMKQMGKPLFIMGLGYIFLKLPYAKNLIPSISASEISMMTQPIVLPLLIFLILGIILWAGGFIWGKFIKKE